MRVHMISATREVIDDMSQELRTEVVCGGIFCRRAELKIYGSDFGFFMSFIKVTIGGRYAPILSLNATSASQQVLTVRIPLGHGVENNVIVYSVTSMNASAWDDEATPSKENSPLKISYTRPKIAGQPPSNIMTTAVTSPFKEQTLVQEKTDTVPPRVGKVLRRPLAQGQGRFSQKV